MSAPQSLSTDQPERKKKSWRAEAAQSGFPVFPVFISREGEKWVKRPLTQHGHLDATTDPEPSPAWDRANGFGILMGAGTYALDFDDPSTDGPPAQWFRAHDIPSATRIHKTPSGGYHAIYRLPEQWHDLRTRANVVPGLDTRGAGGWIAFGEGYSLARDAPIAYLPNAACEALHAGRESIGPVELAAYEPPDADVAKQRVDYAILTGPRLLRQRWQNVKTRGDTSRSARDNSVACLLAIGGLSENDITYALLNLYEHGACRDPAKPFAVRLRAAQRSAAKARLYVEQMEIGTQKMLNSQAITDSDANEILRSMEQ